MDNNYKTIIITGASSGLGRAIALQYSNNHTRLFLFARDESRLTEVERLCRNRHAEVIKIICDVRDADLTRVTIEKIAKKHRIDIIITAAGVSAGTLNKPESSKQVTEIFSANLNGTLNVILPALPSMIKRGHGIIVVISSMAGLFPLSSAPSYSASKAAVKIFGEAMRGYLKQFQLQLCVVIPGYIDTPMTKVNNFPMPFKISAEQAAKIIIAGINNKKNLIIFPKIIYFILKLMSLLPNRLIDYINSKIPGKPAFDE